MTKRNSRVEGRQEENTKGIGRERANRTRKRIERNQQNSSTLSLNFTFVLIKPENDVALQTEKQKEQDEIIKLEEERIKQHHNDVVHNGINKIEQAISKVKCNENKMKSEAKKEVIDQTLKSKKYDQLESINNDTLSFEVFKLQEYNDKYENEHDEEPIIVDDKYLKIMEDIYKMQDELDDLYNVYSVPELSNPQES